MSDPVTRIRGIGRRRADALRKLGVEAVEDLLGLWPRRHRDRTVITPIALVEEGGTYTVEGVVRQAHLKGRPNRPYLSVLVEDQTGVLTVVFFHARWLAKRLPAGTRLVLSGGVERFGARLTMSHPDFEILEEGMKPRLGLVPVYPLTAELSQRWLSDLMAEAVGTLAPAVPDPLPPSFIERYGLAPRAWAVLHQHWPRNGTELERARRRLAFEEFFRLALAVHWLAGQSESALGFVHRPDGPLAQAFLARLPFDLTAGQEAAWAEIRSDLARPRPMARLLQGEVGSGKTVIALLAILAAVDAGHQAAFMAPTELLAEQHYQGLKRHLDPLGVATALIAAGSASEGARSDLAEGKIRVAVGTQALLSEGVAFGDLGLVVVDEQHRFGVRQRARLSDKGIFPDVLVMTATPIPRTMALTVFGDLEVSRIGGMPPGRKPVKTMHVSQQERRIAYEAVLRAVRAGRQAYVVCALVSENPDLGLKGATEVYEGMKSLPAWRVGLIHGQMAADQKNAVMEAFRTGDIDVLVATSIIEVGVDVANATVMVIENADRFGIAQLHQLRGRVGRGSAPAECYLVADPKTEEAAARIEALVRHQDGLKLAELDLELRGPGEVLGMRQHGLVGFQLARPLEDLDLLEEARGAARALLREDPDLARPEHRALRDWMLTAIESGESAQVLN